MGQDYSYSQPSSSEEYDIDITSLLQAEADIYADEAESSQNIAEPFQYPPQPEADDGIPKTCYCGGQPVVATSYTSKDPGRRYFTCDNADDGDCHVWKWWDVASDTEHSPTMDSTPGFVNLLNSQCSFDLDSPEPAWFSSQCPDESTVKERRKWSPKEDKILIGAWLNTSKDPVVSNEQKDAALREQRSGQNDDDVMKAALDIFYNDNGIKFSLEHAWRELRHDKKWCSTFQVDGQEEVGEPEGRPVGVKVAKAASKRKKSGKEEELSQIHAMLEIKEKLSKQKLLERLLGKKEPLSEMETSLKLKLMSEML
ncbi:PREDICTED: glutathione S-transferase T2-like [Brassica oleracea var. oleracea]|uniref:glutathione S-transferase T2-like n=1 Tax=Brassica oleracea var. oleracea TaxID=109376 RepID=UPI0006A6E9A8|nr:PREDICTED: glutathione S-transferase T2-like [Brassica oleracea var. oleracea]